MTVPGTDAGRGPERGSGRRAGVPGRLGSRPAVVLLVLVGAGLALLAAGRTWVGQPVAGVPGLRTVTASGQVAAPGVSAAALVAAAGAIALAVAGRVVRMVVAAVELLSGLGIAALVQVVLADPSGALAPTLETATGQAGAGAGSASSTGWPWLALVAAILILVGGGVAAWRGRSWGTGGRRFEAGTAGGRPGSDSRGPGQQDRRERELDAWDALSRGEDPTD